MQLKLLFFGSCADAAGNAETENDLVENTNQLLDQLFLLYPKLENQKFSIAVNHKIINGNFELKDGDVVALIPPFSGG
ncbi:MAG: MoaD/ThiS family protein [Chitinophagales bacterium]|nr:MoaD/ThiS family protein [Chitinophagales bacterium]